MSYGIEQRIVARVQAEILRSVREFFTAEGFLEVTPSVIEELLKKGIKPTFGFGTGLERLTRFICGLPKIEQATLFPKLPGG